MAYFRGLRFKLGGTSFASIHLIAAKVSFSDIELPISNVRFSRHSRTGVYDPVA
jgi:hypothetical protein